MKTIVPILIVAVALAECLLRAADPPLMTGKVLLLRNDRVLEGDVQRVGERYRVKRLVGETLVPAEQVSCLCASLTEAYAHLRRQANLQDPDERLRLANWCRLNGLREQAVEEVKAAVELRPDHAPTRRMYQHLQQAALTNAIPTVPPAAAREEAAPETPAVELTTESLGMFANRVQPILMNACASCHAVGRGGSFKLERVYDTGMVNRKTLEQNLAAVLAQVNVNQPENSRLLVKAISDHGRTGQAPIRDRRQGAYLTLENWIKQTLTDNPHLRERAPTVVEHRPQGESETQWGADAKAAPPAAPPSPRPTPSSPAPPPPATPTPPAEPDQYDPEPFNRQTHPEQFKPDKERQ
jgi:hypothetical protein